MNGTSSKPAFVDVEDASARAAGCTAFVATVVPTTTWSADSLPASCASPSRIGAGTGSSGVDGTFAVRSVPDPSSSTKSVNVPPVSMPIRRSSSRRHGVGGVEPE